MKRFITLLMTALLLASIAAPALAAPANVNPQQMGHTAYLESLYGKQEAEKIIKSYGGSTMPRIVAPVLPVGTITAPDGTIWQFPVSVPEGSTAWPYYPITTPTAIYYPNVIYPPAPGTGGYYPTYPVNAYTFADAKRLLNDYIDARWDAATYGSFADAYQKLFLMSPLQDLTDKDRNGYVSASALNAIFARVDWVVARP